MIVLWQEAVNDHKRSKYPASKPEAHGRSI